MNIDEVVRAYDLKPHPEGGFFRETYRSGESVARKALPGRFSGDRSFSTAILYLMPAGLKSKWHRIRSDEVWHFHLGEAFTVEEITPEGRLERAALGPDALKGHRLQHAVKAGRWFRSVCPPGTDWSLAGCTVAPGFDFADFESIRPEELAIAYPALGIGELV